MHRAPKHLRYWIVSLFFLMVVPSHAQDTPVIPVGLTDPYVMFIPVGWRTIEDDPFGFIAVSNDTITLNVLDPVRFEQYMPYNPDATPRQLLIDYWQSFYVETINRLQIELMTLGDNVVAIYPDAEHPELATYIVQLVDGRFALVDVRTADDTYDDERDIVHTILETLSLSVEGEIRTEVAYERVVLPSNLYSVNMPDGWFIEPSLVPGQVFIVGDGVETILLAPNTITASFDFPPDIELIDLAQVIESAFFDTDITNIEVTESQLGDLKLIAYGFRSIVAQTDTQVILVQLPDGGIAYYRTTTLQDVFTPVLQDRIRRVATSIQPYVDEDTALFGDDIRANIVPSSGEWRVTPRDMMRFVCDGDIAERLIPLTDNIRDLFSDFDVIVADPDGRSVTVANDGIISLFQRGTLLRDDTLYFQLIEEDLAYIITPRTEDLMIGRLNIIAPDENGKNCRQGVSILLRFAE